MSTSREKATPKKKLGRPATGRDPTMALRMPIEERRAVEAWAAQQPDKLTLSKAIRRLIELGLTAKPAPAKPRRPTKRGVTGL
jgi:hypothetical protein